MWKEKKKGPKPKTEWTEMELKREVWAKLITQARNGLIDTMQAMEYQQTIIDVCEQKLRLLDEAEKS